MKNITDPITGETLAALLGMKPADATPQTLSATLAGLIALSSVITIKDGKIVALSGLIADGKITVLGDLPDRLKKIEEAGTKSIATLSATIDGKVLTFSAEDVVGVVNRLDVLEQKITDDEKAITETAVDRIVKTFSADGKVPKKFDGTAYSADELRKLDLGTLQILSANTPVTVALSARNLTGNTGDKQTQFKDANGKVDLAALLDAENAANA